MVLVILDGWGIDVPGPGNAISQAKLPNYTRFWFSFPHTTLVASGEAVGLPRGECGNTETGHLNLGAGRIVYQDLPRINMAIADGSFFDNTAFLMAIRHAKKTGGKVHLAGLVGSGGVHSNIEHLFALIHLSQEQQFTDLIIHIFTDGRDSPPTSTLLYIEKLQQELAEMKIGRIATVMGRYFAMDRDNRWDRTEKAYKALVLGEGQKADSIEEAVQRSYGANITDEFIEPTVIVDSQNKKPLATVEEGDAIIFYNFRVDRLRQLTKAFVLENFEDEVLGARGFDPYTIKYFKKHQVEELAVRKPFHRGPKIPNIFVVTMTEYEKGLAVDAIAFPTQVQTRTVGEIVALHSLSQLRVSESEKERFVTYYFSGQREEKFRREDWLIVPSPKVATYDLKPAMAANELTEALIARISTQKYQFVVVNFANPDMVGHTGMIAPAVKACEAVDNCLGKLVTAVFRQNGYCIITADHGNVETMLNRGGTVDTEHSRNPVPFIALAKEWEGQGVELSTGILADVGPTILKLLGLAKPKEMTGRYLLH